MSVTYRGKVERADDRGVYVSISELGGATYGPLEIVKTGKALPVSYVVGDRVIVQQIGAVAEDLVVIGHAIRYVDTPPTPGSLPPVGPDGDVLTVVSGEWASAAPTGGGGGGGSGAVRSTEVLTTATLAPDASEDLEVDWGASFNILMLESDTACRVTVYLDENYAEDDEDRPVYIYPTGPHGVFLDVTLDGATPLPVIPPSLGFTMGVPNIVRITNISGSSAAVEVTALVLVLEAS